MASFMSNPDDFKLETVPLKDMHFAYAIDTSGSTSRVEPIRRKRILQCQRESAELMSNYLPIGQVISWHNRASISSLDNLTSTGLTIPSTFVPLIFPNAQGIIVYTDGLIYDEEVEHFSETLLQANFRKLPTVIVFTPTIDSGLHLGTALETLERQINMSIPRALSKVTHHVLVLFNLPDGHRLFSATGCFASSFLSPNLNTEDTAKLKDLPPVNLEKLLETEWVHRNDEGHLDLGSLGMLNLERFYQTEAVPPLDIILQLSNQVYFAQQQVDLTRLENAVVYWLREVQRDPELESLQNEIAALVAEGHVGSQTLKDKVAAYHNLRLQHRTEQKREVARKLNQLHRAIIDYRSGSHSFQLGSNRANRALTISEDDVNNLDGCVTIECPIACCDDIACLLVRTPDNHNGLLEYCTSNWSMEAPFHFGETLASEFTPQLIGKTVASLMTTNPYTRESVSGYIPLTSNPRTAMAYMSCQFGAKKVLWHFTRAYLGLMVHGVQNWNWLPKSEVVEHLRKLASKYYATKDLRGGTEKVPLEEALKYVVTSYWMCLRRRFPNDIRTIVKIVDTLYPDYAYPREKILRMASIMEAFSRILRHYKEGEDMKQYIFECSKDEFLHPVGERQDIDALIARIIWHDDPRYQYKSFESALYDALQHPVYGDELRNAFSSTHDLSKPKYQLIAEEPTGEHFENEERYGKWDGDVRPHDVCVYCGYQFETKEQLYSHLKTVYGKYMFNGIKGVKQAIRQCGSAASQPDIFSAAMKYLYKKYGEKYPVLHTQYAKRRILLFIQKVTEKQ